MSFCIGFGQMIVHDPQHLACEGRRDYTSLLQRPAAAQIRYQKIGMPKKRRTILGLLGMLSLVNTAISYAEPPMGDTEKAVARREGQWLQSQKSNNAELLVPLLADRFVNTNTDGKVTNKAETLARAKATKWTSAEYENLQVTVFGDAAIAAGLFVGKGTDARGMPMDDHERFTDTWVKMSDGKWQCVASHGSEVKG